MRKTLLPKKFAKWHIFSDYGENPSHSRRLNLQRYWSYSLLLLFGILCQTNIATAQMGKSLNLNGTNDYLQAPAGVYFTGGDVTVETWVYPRSFGAASRVFDFGNGQSNNNVLLHFYGAGGLRLYSSAGSGAYIDSNIPVVLNQWTHLAVTLNGANATIYVNGQIAASGTVGLPVNITRTLCYIGNSNWNDGMTNAKYDEFRIWNVVRTQEQIQDNLNRTLTGTETGLQVYYNMETIAANGQGQTVTDLAAAGGVQNATTYGTANTPTNAALDASTTWANDLYFDGVNDYVSITNASTGAVWSSFTSAVTIETWINPEVYGGNGTVFCKDNGAGTASFVLRYEGANLMFYVNSNGAGTDLSIPSTLTPLNQWSHLACVYDGTTMKAYINGILVGTTARTGTIANPAVPVFIGATPNQNWLLKGSLDEFRVWNVARTQTEIQQNMASVSPTTAGLVAYYPFNQGTASGTNTAITTVTDVSANALNGTLTNFALTGNTSNFTARSTSVTTPTKTGITGTTAVVGATYTQYVSDLVEKGVVFNTTGNPSLTNGRKAVSSGNAAGAYTTAATNLKGGTKYYYRGYVYTNNAINYSAIDSFTTTQTDLGNALAFDASLNNHFYVGTSPTSINANPIFNTITNALTLEVWLKPKDYSTQRFLNRQDQNGYNWALQISGGSIVFSANSTTSGSNVVAVPQSYVPLNQWTHVAGVYNGSQMQLYINGVLVGTTTQTGALHTSSAFVGVGTAGNVGGPYNGTMDEVRIWNVARTQAQILANMSAPISTTSTGLICYFPFDQGIANAPNPSVSTPIEAVSNLPVVYGGTFAMIGNNSNWVSHSDVSFTSTSTNNVLHFDGANDHAIITNASTGVWNTFASAVTIETWLNPEVYGGNGTVFSKDNGAGTYSFLLRYEGANLAFYINAGSGGSILTLPSTLTPLNQWSHIACTYDGTNMRVYINGNLAATTAKTGTIANPSVAIIIGATSNQGWYYKGSLDEMRVWNVARSQTEIQNNMNSVAANSTGLVAYYPFNQGVANGTNTGITAVTDVTSNALNGAMQNFSLTGATSNFITPYFPSANNNALDFDGTNDYVQVPAGNYFNGGNFTIESWVYPKVFNGYARVMDFGGGSASNNVLLTYSNGQPIFQIYNGATLILDIVSSVVITVGKWWHIAATINGNVATLYINGQVAGSTTFSGTAPNVSLANCYIGRSNFAGEPYANAMMDEFRIWNVARTQAQLQDNANISIPSGTAGLTLYYPFNQGVAFGTNTSVITATDASASNITATLNNFTLSGFTSNWVWGSGLFNSSGSDGKPVITNVQAAQATFASTSSTSNGASIQEQGFIYNVGTTIPTLGASTKVVAGTTTSGAFSATATGLAENQLYTVRTYITTSNGTALSTPNTFTTSLCRIYPQDMTFVITSSSANVSWTTNTTGATAYTWKVVNSGAGLNGTAIASGTTTATTVAITGLTFGKDYDFYLLITGGCTTTTWSDVRPFSTKMEWANALQFDGTNDYADAGNATAVNNLTSNATIEAWVRPTSNTGTRVIFDKSTSGNGITLSTVNGIPTVSISTPTLGTVSGTTALTLNQWSHIAAVYNGTNVILYVNGLQVGTLAKTGNLAANATSVFIGKGATTSYFAGMIDEMKVWNVARTQTQLWAGMNSGVLANTADVILAYSFNEGIANDINTGINVAKDSSASAAHATLNGFALANNVSNWVAHAPYNGLAAAPVVSMTATSAVLNGTLTQVGTGTITEKGILWNVGTALPTFATSTRVAAVGTATGTFATNATGLTLGQSYTFRSYSISSDGYYLSAPSTFVLDLCGSAPALNTITSSNITATAATFSWATVVGIPSYEWIVAQSGFGIANPTFSGTSTTGTVNVTGLEIGVNYDFFLRANCGATQSPWQTPVTFQTLAAPTFTTNSVLNDAYVDINWTLHPLPCLLNNGTPYTQGIYVKVTDLADGKVLKQEPITNLAPFIGAQQPTFNYVAGDSVLGYGCIVDNTNGWQAYNSSTWTIEAWVKGNISSNNVEIFKASLVNNAIIKITGSVISVQKNAVSTNFATPLPLGKWKHLAFTYNGSTVALFIDGVKKEEKAISNLVFGGGAATYSVANNCKNLQIGEIRYWNRVRTDIEIGDNRWATSFPSLVQSNLLLHLRWNTNNAAPVDLATAYDGQNNTVTYNGTGILPTFPYITTPDYTPIVGTFRHYVGPTKAKNYKLEVFQIGSGAAISACTNLTTTGSTIAFQQPINGTATTTLLDRVRLQWTNKSKLSETFKIFRGGVLRGVIAGSGQLDSVFTWEDVYSADDSLSIVNGTSYAYCIETYCNNLNSAYTPQLCRTGNTFNLNFTATDGTPSNKVNLSWANVASYGYNVQIKREGILIATLPAATVTYADANPIYGKVAKYEVALVDGSTSELIVAKSDNGSVPARGSISGRVVTFENNYALKNVRIKLHSLVDTLVNLTTYTDYLGNFSFNNLYYEKGGDFEIKADYGNHIFIEPLKTITLTDAKFAVTNVEFLDSTGLTISATPLDVSNFQGTSMLTQDKINFAWAANLSSGDTVLYDIYREATRIATLTNLTNALTYADLGGEPNVSYKYKLNAYKVQNNVITAIELADTLLFPKVAVTSGFTAVPNTTLGVVNMAWSHTSTNFDGFRIYRNGKKIAEIPVGTTSFVDADAKPGTSATYILKAKRFLNNITFESLGQTVSNVNVPALPAVTGVTATANTTRNSVLVSWTIPAALIATYNYDGFRVYRRTSGAAATTDVYIGQLPKAINPAYEDKTAIPSTAYTYTVKSYLRLSDNSLGESNGASANATHPVVTPVTALTASTTLAGEVALSWTPPSAAIRNLDGIVVLRGTDTLAVLPYNANTFRVFTNSTVSTSYSVRVFRNVAGVRRFSAVLSASGKAATGSTVIEYATNVSTTKDLANHVRLSWEYPSYVLSTFKIYRDNVLIATLPTESRVYLDNAAVPGTTHFYQIEAINGANISQKAGAQGRLRSIRELNGMVYSTTDKYGIPNVDVYVSGTGFTGHTRTDSSGFYVFSGLPETAGTSLVVSVDGYGANYTSTIVPSSQTFAIATGTTVYTRNFGSSYTPAITDTIAPTRPMNIIAKTNPSRRRVSVTWTPSNSYYDGFEVYRANVLLANVKKGENLVAYDTAGYPGISYTYQIRSYQNTNTNPKYSSFYSTTGTYPVLEAPIILTSTSNLALNTLKLTWSHNWDNHTRYEVSRNDSILARVNIGDNLEYVDVSGTPGQQYVYVVKAVMVVGSKTYYSDAATITVQYPTIAEPENVTVTSPTISTSYLTPCTTNVTQERNFVDINWTYNANALLKGFRVYRAEILLATLSKDSLHFRDYEGYPGNIQPYIVKSILERNGDNYYSEGVTVTKMYPTLATPVNVTSKDTLGAKEIAWAYPDGGALSFYIFRDNALIDTVLADSMGQKAFVYLDQTGVSGTSYNYILKAYTKRNEVNYWSEDYSCLTGLVYPKPVTPTNVAATDGMYFSYVKVSWNYPSGADITGFNIFRDGTQIATVAGGIKSYSDLTANGIAAYAVQAYKSATFQGTAYTNNSNISVADSGSMGQTGIALQYLNPSASAPSKNFGFSLDIDGGNLAVGAPNMTGVAGTSANAQLWHFANNTFVYDWAENSTNTSLNGYDVTSYNGIMLSGMPNLQFVRRITFDPTSRAFVSSFAERPTWIALNKDGLGATVASSSEGRWFGAPLSSGGNFVQVHGMVFAEHNNTGYSTYYYYSGYYVPNSNSNANFGVSLDASTNFVVVGDTVTNNVYVQTPLGFNVYALVTPSMQIPTPANMGTYPQFGRAVSVSAQDRIIVGAPKTLVNGSRVGRAYVYEKQGSIWVLVSTLNSPDGSAGDGFGTSVSMSGDRAIVGAPNYGSGKGSVYVFERNSSGQWNYAFKYEGIAGCNLGYSVELSDNYLVAGAPNANAGEGKIAWLNVGNLSVSSVVASQGTLNGQTKVEWTSLGSPTISGFKIYRDGALLQTASTSDRYFYDVNGVSGKHYIYEVCSYTSVGENTRKAAEGWSKADGYLEGRVVTTLGGGGVGGVSIKAVANIDGNDYIYNAVTNNNGDYNMSNVYYGDAVTNFTLSADYGDHLFLTNPIYTNLSPSQKSRVTLYFQDKTAYTISGTVGRPNVNTYLDSIHVSGEYIMADSSLEMFTQSVYTSSEGKYSLTFNPYKPNAIGMRINIDSTEILVTEKGSDTLHYRFQALQTSEFSSLAGMSQNVTLNFEDTLTYPVRLEVLSACRNAITGGNFKIRVRSKDDSYDKVFTTDLTGKVTAKLPPLQYIVNVDGVVNNTAANQLAIDYLRYRPQTLDIYTPYKDSLYHEDAAFWDSLTRQEFIYHRPPSITVLSGFDRYLCDNPNNPAIIKQGTKYSLRFQVGETFNNTPCVARTGYLVIKNAASSKDRDTVYVNRENGNVDTYTFTAGDPNLVTPHRHTMTIEYRTDIGELIAVKTTAIIVEGLAALPGADIIVDLGQGTVPLPLFTLRDPYGDGSSSTIEEGSTLTKEFGFSTDMTVTTGLSVGFEFKKPIIVKAGLAMGISVGAGLERAWALTATTTEAISTSGADDHVGPKADVIVGAGVALQYGLVQEIKVINCNNITKTQKLGFAPHSVQTTWHYTVMQIEELIRQYEIQLVQIEEGTLVIEEGGKAISKEAAKSRFNTYKSNWEQILVYHNRETLPWYNLCKKRTDLATYLDPVLLGRYLEWKFNFCPLVGSYDGDGNFNPKDNIVWDQPLVTAYNNTMTATRIIYEVLGPLHLVGEELTNWSYSNGALSDPYKYVDDAYIWLHDLQAQNITYGSGVTIDKSYESAASASTTLKVNAGLTLGTNLTIGAGSEALAGWIAEAVVAELEASVELTFGFEWNFETSLTSSKENTNNISYSLSDDDDFDQFSVTIIQGIDPHQTPYFSLLGGRSSCPQEEGTIYRDNPMITVYDEPTQSTSAEGTAYFVEPNEPARFTLQVSNQNPFNEDRSVSITLDALSNLDGAKVIIAGTPMIAGQAITLSLPPDEPILVPVSVERGYWAYDYEGLTLNIDAGCGGLAGDNDISKSVMLNVHFKNECSPITIAEPDGYWTILKQNVNDPNSREVLPIRLMDYDPYNDNLLETHLEYRRKGNGLTWHQIPQSELSPTTLQTWNEENFLASQVPYYMYSWDITGDYQTYPDGEYEVRAVAECGLGGRVYSNSIKGAIERKTNLYGLPQPSDKVWTVGDEISVAFNLDIDCAGIADSNFVIQKYGDPTTTLPGTVACANNKLIFSPDLSLMQYFDGDTLEMIVGGVRTFNGNVLDTVRWTFLVISRDLYVTNDSLSVELTQGQTADLATTLVNNVRTGQSLNYHIQNLASAASWLSSSDSTGTVLFNSPKDLSFHINSKEMPIGTTTLNLDIFANGRLFEDAIYVKVKVLPKGPDWDFDPSAYSQDMTLVANYNFNNTNVKSTDTTDLISVWIDNQLRGVANINKFTTTLYSAVISVYGNPSDFGKSLKFRIWDASVGVEYDARPDANAVISFAPDKIEGSVSSPRLLDVFTASDKVRYIPLNQGWTMFSVNTNRWNAPLNTAISSLRHPHDGDVIKTANKSAEYVSASNSWVSTNGLDSANVHRGYQIYLQEADTLRITGSAAAISPISLNYGWNFVGYPPQTALGIDFAFAFLGQPDSVTLKTTAQNPTYSRNMVAIYDNNSWKYTSNSDMDMLYPNFAYKMRVNTIGSQLYFEGANASQAPVTLLRLGQQNGTPDPEDPETWFVNPADYEYNSLITATVNIDKAEARNTSTKVAAFVGDECRGVGELVYVKELDRYMMQMMVYSNGKKEEIEFHIFDADKKRRYNHYEVVTFAKDDLMGTLSAPYSFRNTPPDAAITGNVYPNPFENRLKVRLNSDKAQSYTLRLTDLMGHTLMEKQISDKTNMTQLTLDTANLDLVEGVYLLQVIGSLGETLTFKVVHFKQ
jgi:hypothetical protein